MRETSKKVLLALQHEIAKHDTPQNQINYQRFFKEPLEEPIGLKTDVVRKISRESFAPLKSLSPEELLTLCDDLLASGKRYMRFFAFEWALKAKDEYRKTEFRRFESWLKQYVDSWAACDHLCGGPIGHLLSRFPSLAPKVYLWTRAKSRWLRRAAAVSLIVPVRKGQLLDDVSRTADALLVDEDDMVQKGYGWMLKEASNVFPEEVFAYVMAHKARMPRTALRYAIEKLPSSMRQQAMAKER